MKVRRIGFLGTRTASFGETSAFFQDVLGLEVSHREPDWSVFRLESGPFDLVEVYGPAKRDERLFPVNDDGALMAGFIVDDVVAARDEAIAAGAEVLGDIVWAEETFGDPALEGFGWFFLRAPDRNVYAIQQEGHRERT